MKKGKRGLAVECICTCLREWLFYRNSRWKFVCERFLKKGYDIETRYDVAIDYQGLGSSILGLPFVAHKIHANKRIAWIHQDVNYMTEEAKSFSNYLDLFDNIVCVSSASKKEFDTQFPKYKEKTTVFYNLVDKEELTKKSVEPNEYDIKEKVLILSVGRLDYQKGFDIAIKALKDIKDSIPDFLYVIVGSGSEGSLLQKTIEETGLIENVRLLGRKDNPYPYYRNADLYLQPSRFEGFCITLAEAKVFNIPIVTTDFAGAREQIRNMETGMIVRCEQSAIAHGIEQLINSRDLQSTFSSNLRLENELKSDLSELFVFFEKNKARMNAMVKED
ncbi:MAG: glycosyltransferase [Hespellia sp.]|nr:glycosyltransferase [Hespellia sp.]